MFSRSMKQRFSLSERVVLITGGAGFLGKQYAEAIAEMDGIPILLDLDSEKIESVLDELHTKGFGRCRGRVLDITDANTVRRTVGLILQEFEKVHVLINNAAFAMEGLINEGREAFSPIEDYPLDIWEMALKVNMTGTFLITQAVGQKMIKARQGVIINIASDVGVVSPDWRIYEPDETSGYSGVSFNTPIHYSATKAAIISMTRHLATHWAPYNIRVNALSIAGMEKNQDPQFIEKLSNLIPLGRMAQQYEYNGAIIFLASDASSFMTGANLVVDGGRTCW